MTINRVIQLLEYLLNMSNGFTHFNDVETTFSELEQLSYSLVYKDKLAFHYENIIIALDERGGYLKAVKQEILEMLYVVDDIIHSLEYVAN